MQLCAITDRRSLAPAEPERTDRLLSLAAEWARKRVDFVQLREKDLSSEELLQLSCRIVASIQSVGSSTRVLLNGSVATAIESGAAGIHLPGGHHPGRIDTVRGFWRTSSRTGDPLISVACHSVEDVRLARVEGADLLIFAPVFGKRLESGEMLAGSGLAALELACRTSGALPVFALGGVTADNAEQCIASGAAGIAGIRLFAGSDWRRLR